jgi:AcrR family transcriptional regulator
MSTRYHHGRLKAALVDETLRLAQEGGSAAVTLRTAARRAGVTHAAVYRHFANRLDLLAATATDAMNRLADRLEAAVASPEPDIHRMKALAGAYLEWADQDPGSFRLAFCQELWDKRPYPALRAASDRASRPVLELASSITSDPDEARRLAVAVWAQTHGMTELWVARQLSQGKLSLPGDSSASARRALEEAVGRLSESNET